MFKKIMKLFSSIVLLFVFVCIFTSCDSEESKTSHTTHSYSYKSNAQKHWQECSCGDKKNEEDHTFGNWTITKEPTLTTTGTKERECSVCHYKETDTIAVLTHDTHSYTETKSNETKHWKECACGDKKDEEDHTFGSWTITKEPTETTDGVKGRECSVCHYKETDTIAKHAHSYTETKSNETKHWKECSCGAKSEEENHTFGNWQTIKEASYTEKGLKKRVCSKCNYEETEDIAIKEITNISTFIKDNNDIITANLETHYENAVKKAHGRYYDTERFTMTSYRWDLGEVVEGKIQNLKVILKYHNNLASVDIISIYNVTLNETIEITSLLDATTMTNTKATYSSAYSYSYDATKQHDMDEVWKKLAELELKGFEYDEVLYNRTGTSLEFGGASSGYTISYIGKSGVKEITVVIKNSNTNEGKVVELQNSNYIVRELKEINFTSNQLKEVDLTAPTDPNSIEYLIYYHNDEITANLETHYINAVKKAYGRYYDTERFTMTSYRWDLGDVTEGKIQNLKVILKYHNNVTSNDIIHIYNVTLNEAIEITSLLDATTMTNIKATYSSAYSYTYDATKQHDREDLIKAILDVAVTDGFKYEMKDVIYKENTQSTDSTLGTIERFSIVITNENAIREISMAIAIGSNDTALINNINKGKYIKSFTDMVNFTSNQLIEVDLTKK